MPTNREAQNWLKWKQAALERKLRAEQLAKIMAVMKK